MAKSGPWRKRSLKGIKKGPLFEKRGTKKGPVFVKKGTHPNNQGSRIISCLNENNIIEPITSSFVFQWSLNQTTPTHNDMLLPIWQYKRVRAHHQAKIYPKYRRVRAHHQAKLYLEYKCVRAHLSPSKNLSQIRVCQSTSMESMKRPGDEATELRKGAKQLGG